MSSLGSHASFIVGAYAVAAAVIGALLVWVIADYRQQRRALDELQRQGISRRAETPSRIVTMPATE